MSKLANAAEPPRLYVVTNNAQQAAIDLFHCDLELVPAWSRIVSDVADLAAIPTGAKVMALWFGPLMQPIHTRSMIEQIWREERQRRSFDDDFGRHETALKEWHDKRWADATADPAARPEPAPSVSAPAAEPVSPVLPRKSRWS